jgi:hypothetical protein
MKINVNIDCSPEEARNFLGLPDIKPMQDALLKQVEDRMAASLNAMDPDTMLKTWLPAGIQGVEQWQKMFWNSLADQFAGKASSSKSTK